MRIMQEFVNFLEKSAKDNSGNLFCCLHNRGICVIVATAQLYYLKEGILL